MIHRPGRFRGLLQVILMMLIVSTVWFIYKCDFHPHGVGLLGGILFSKSSRELAIEREIERDIMRIVPELCNEGASCSLTGREAVLGAISYEASGINVVLSDKISYNRTPPDVLGEACKSVEFDLSALPSVSIIIIFYEEPYSVLLRTIHSVLNTTPWSVLREIILVDDASTLPELEDKLPHYVMTRLPKFVKLLRLPQQ